MKTLDEVIKAWSICFSDNSRSNCTGCPYADEDGEAACFNHDREDALHYLKTYRENQHAYEEGNRKAEEARERYLEAVKNCELAENKYRKLWKETSQNFADTSQKITCPQCHSEFVILPEANNALTWDELRTMEGLPVWVEIISDEIDLSSRWMMVARETKAHSLPLAYTDDMGHWIYGHEDDLGKTWQAYRKERE